MVHHISEINDADRARGLRPINQQVVRVEIIMHDLRAQMRQAGRDIGVEVVQHSQQTGAQYLIFNCVQHGAQAVRLLDIPLQNMACRRVEKPAHRQGQPRQ